MTELIKIPDHVDAVTFRSVLAAYTTAYRTLGREPAVSEVHDYWPRMPIQAMSEMIALTEFGDALKARGISSQSRGLSALQHTVLLALGDLSDKRSDKAKIEECGATTKQVALWMHNPLFANARRSLATRGWEHRAPAIMDTVAQQAEAGSFQQQQYVLDALGLGPKAREQQSAREAIQEIIAAIQRATVGMPDVRQRILDEIQSGRQMAQLTADQ